MSTSPQNEEPTIARQLGMFALVVTSFLGASGGGLAIGWLLWKKAGFPWWVMVLTAILGLYGACMQVFRYQKILSGGKSSGKGSA